jgi:hypothetical protein
MLQTSLLLSSPVVSLTSAFCNSIQQYLSVSIPLSLFSYSYVLNISPLRGYYIFPLPLFLPGLKPRATDMTPRWGFTQPTHYSLLSILLKIPILLPILHRRFCYFIVNPCFSSFAYSGSNNFIHYLI